REVSVAFDWISFLDQHDIAYRRQGKHLRLLCPFCAAPNDRRMSIDLEGQGWWCWVGRDQHSGISPNRLVAGLLRCSIQQAAIIAGVRRDGAKSIDNFADRIDALLAPEAPAAEESLRWPREFRPIDDAPMARPFVAYLLNRGFSRDQIMEMTSRYGLHY